MHEEKPIIYYLIGDGSRVVEAGNYSNLLTNLQVVGIQVRKEFKGALVVEENNG